MARFDEEIRHFKSTGHLRCPNCKTPFVPARDSITGRKSKHLWKNNCNCYKKDIQLSIG